MPTPIRWTKKQQRELRRAVKNFNARLKRAQQKTKNLELLPEKATVKQAKEDIYSAKDLQKYVKSLKNFTAQTTEIVTNVHGVQATIWEVQETKRRVKAENARRAAAQKQKKPVYSQGVEITGAEMMSRKNENKPITTDFSKIRTQSEWTKFTKFAENLFDKKRGETDPTIYKQEYIKALEKMGITDIYITAAVNAIGDKLLDLYTAGHTSTNISFVYDDSVSQTDKAEEIKQDLFSIIHELGYYKEFFTELQKLQPVADVLLNKWKHKGYKNTFEMLENGDDIFILDNFS